MPASTVNLRYFVLGLLAQQPMSGYDIRCFLKSLSWLIGSPSSGSLYPILRDLLEEGLVSMEIIPGLDKPPRKIYSMEEVGRQVLQAWIDQPVASEAPLKAFVMRLLLASSFPPASLVAHLQRRRSQVASHQAELAGMTGALDGATDLGLFLALSYGAALAEAELDWLDGTLKEWSQQLPRQGDQRCNSTT